MRDHDEDIAWQQREITGTTLHLCERCGRPLDPEGVDAITLTEPTSPLAEPTEGERLCADCYTRMGNSESAIIWDDDDEDDTVS
jgi:hypothetical protein